MTRIETGGAASIDGSMALDGRTFENLGTVTYTGGNSTALVGQNGAVFDNQIGGVIDFASVSDPFEVGDGVGIDPGERVGEPGPEVSAHRAAATNASNSGRPDPESPVGRCQSSTWSSGCGMRPTTLPASSQMPAMSFTEPLGFAG